MNIVHAAATMLALLLLCAIAHRPAAAEIHRPWCVGYTATISLSCTFVSFEQCMETARGGGGSCMQNPWYLQYGERGQTTDAKQSSGRRSGTRFRRKAGLTRTRVATLNTAVSVRQRTLALRPRRPLAGPFRTFRRRAGTVRGRLNEMINDVYRILRGDVPVQACDFFPPLRRILATHHPLPDYP